MRLLNKIKWILGILMIFTLIVSTNLIDRNNFIKLKDSTSDIYENRLVAKSILYDISILIHEKEIQITSNNFVYFQKTNLEANIEIERLVSDYKKTKLTYQETKKINELDENLIALKKNESINSLEDLSKNKEKLLLQIQKIKSNLYSLSQIQMSEGKKQVQISQETIDTIELFTNIEIYVLICLAIAIQIVVMYKPNKSSDLES